MRALQKYHTNIANCYVRRYFFRIFMVMKKPSKVNSNLTFKQDRRGESLLFPVSLESWLPAYHPVRFIDSIIDEMDISDLFSSYSGGGTSVYHPRMMLKLLCYGYMDRCYSSRVLEKQTRENLCYMWLCGSQTPDHSTIARFRTKRMKNSIKEVFAQVVRLLFEKGVILLKDQKTDGTKMESVANRHSHVWQKNINRFKGNLEEKIVQLLAEIDDAIEIEEAPNSMESHRSVDSNQDDGDDSSANPSIKSEDLTEKIAELQAHNDKEILKYAKKLEKQKDKLAEYEAKLAQLNGRNSYSKTDPDATFMRLKDDRLRPSYNLMNSTEDQYIINYTIHQNANDGTCYISHTEDTLALLANQNLPSFQAANGDAAFGTEENYEYLEKKGITNYLKYGSFYRETTNKFKKDISQSRNFFYNVTHDFYVCAMGQKLHPVKTITKETKSGYQQELTVYQAQNCQGCPLRSMCQKTKRQQPIKGNRTVTRNKNLERHRVIARTNLESEKGIQLRKARGIDVEPPFGNIKYNKRFNRLTLKSIPKINIEVGLISIVHNLNKLWRQNLKDKINIDNPSQIWKKVIPEIPLDGIGMSCSENLEQKQRNKGEKSHFFAFSRFLATVGAHQLHHRKFALQRI